MMVSPKAAEAAGDKFGLHPVCAGPYKFVERVQQDRIVVEKFADYWDKDKVSIDKITYLPIVDGTVRLANLRSGGARPDLERVQAGRHRKTVRDDKKLRPREGGGRFGGLACSSTSTAAPRPTTRWPRTAGCARRWGFRGSTARR